MTAEQWNQILDFGVPEPEDYLIEGPQIMLRGGPFRAVVTGASLSTASRLSSAQCP
jgi:hypothetical protein